MPGKLENALQQTGYRFAHFGWSPAPEGDYGAWSEDSGDDFIANNVHAERGTSYTVDYYTRDASGTARDTIERALHGLRCGWRLDTIMYENDTGYIHYAWRVFIAGDPNAETDGGP